MTPRLCRGCGAPFTVVGVGGGPIRYCEPCRAQFCRKCSRRGGQHAPGCGRASPRTCRGCDAPIFLGASLAQHQAVVGVGGRGVLDGRSLRYCLACRAKQCGTCQRAAGLHAPDCPVGAGRARVALPYVGAVDEQDVVSVYEGTRWAAVRTAATICGPAEAEDVVQTAALYLWQRRDTLTDISPGFFMIVVKQKALARTRSAWRRHVAPTDDLVAVERRLAGGVRGRPSQTTVRLPAPPEAVPK